MPTLMNCLAVSMADNQCREPALFTFLFTASGIDLLGIGSAFWGLCTGLSFYWFYNYKASAGPKNSPSSTQ